MTVVRGLRFGTGIGDIENVTELQVETADGMQYIMITDIGEGQNVMVSETPLFDRYMEIVKLPNKEFGVAIRELRSSTSYVEDKEPDSWYAVNGKPFENAVKLAALASQYCPYGEPEVYEIEADCFIRKYLGKDIDGMELPETYRIDEEDEE